MARLRLEIDGNRTRIHDKNKYYLFRVAAKM